MGNHIVVKSRIPQGEDDSFSGETPPSLEEAARGLSEAMAQSLCLVQSSKGPGAKYIILFDGKKCLDNLGDFLEALVPAQGTIEQLEKIKARVFAKFGAYFRLYLNIPMERAKPLQLERWLRKLSRILKDIEEFPESHELAYFLEAVPEAKTWTYEKDIAPFLEEILEAQKGLDPERIDDLRRSNLSLPDHFPRAFSESIIGFISFSQIGESGYCEEKNVLNVDLSAAEKGWGPMLYDLALSLVYPKFLTSGRDSVSKDAENVWSYYLLNRPDVTHILMPSVLKGECDVPNVDQELAGRAREAQNRVTYLTQAMQRYGPTTELTTEYRKAEREYLLLKDKLEKTMARHPLAHKYRINNPIVAGSALEGNTEKFLKELEEKYRLSTKGQSLLHAGEAYFEKKYSRR